MLLRDNAPPMVNVFDGQIWRQFYLQHGQPPREWEHKAVYRLSKEAQKDYEGKPLPVVLIGVED